MRLLLLYNKPGPAGGLAMTSRLHLYAKCLFEQDVNIEVAVPSSGRDSIDTIYEGINYSTYKNPVIYKNYLLHQINRFFAAFYYALFCFRAARKNNVFLIVGFGWFASLLMIAGTHLGGAGIVMEVNENPYSPEGGRMDPVWIRKIRRQLMLNLPYQFADGFIVISEPLEELVKIKKKKNAYVIKIPILADKTAEKILPLKTIEYPFILHTGDLSETKDGAIAMFEAFSKVISQVAVPLHFILTTNVIQPELLKKIESIVNKSGFKSRVVYKGYVSAKELVELRNSCTMAIINKPPNWQNDFNFPTKLGEMLMSGIPLIASSSGEAGKYLKDNETAFIVPANDKDAIAEKIIRILENPDFAVKVGQNGRELALRKFYFMNYSYELSSFFEDILSEK